MNLCWADAEMTITENKITINSELLGREVACTILMPDELDAAQPVNLLLMNDGQETDALELKSTLEKLHNSRSIKQTIVVGINAGEERLQEYGVAGRPDYKKRGAKADIYTDFIKSELLPALKEVLPVHDFEVTAIAGLSLGGLTALDIAWNNPELFNKVGIFSGSLWWRSKELGKGYTEADRIAHAMINEATGKPELKFWFQTGTKDETADRNKNGIIDSIDDTIDLIRELENKGYTRPEDIAYIEVVGGKHDAATWAKAMPKFLVWAFGK